MKDDLTIIIPTLGVRPKELNRAINSCLIQCSIRTQVLIVFNGKEYRSETLESLSDLEGVSIHETIETGVSNSRRYALQFVQTDYFAFLDDDDEFLPNRLAIPLNQLVEDQSLDLIVFNGIKQDVTSRDFEVCFKRFNAESSHLEKDLVQENWLASSGAIFRNSVIGHDVFSNLPNHLEFTVIAFRLARQFKIKMIPDKIFKLNIESNERVSSSLEYFINQPKVLKLIQSETNDCEIKTLLAMKICNSWHELSDESLSAGKLPLARKAHFESLKTIKSFLKYFLYSRKVI